MYSTYTPSGQLTAVAAPFVDTVPLSMAGRIWTLRFSALPSLTVDRTKPLIVLGGGLAVSFLLSAIAWSLAKNRRQAAAANQRLQSDIARSEESSEGKECVSTCRSWRSP